MVEVFVVSTGRTATGWLAHNINKNTHYLGKHEPHPRLRHNIVSYYKGEITRDELSKIFKDRTEKIRGNAEHYFESNWAFTPIVDIIHDCYPESKIVYIIRNPVDFVRSFATRYTTKNTEESIVTDRLSPFLFKDDPATQWWKEGDRTKKQSFMKALWIWNKYLNVAQEFAKTIPMMLLKMEDMFNPPYTDMLLFNIFIGVDYDFSDLIIKKYDSWANKYIYPSIENWTDEMRTKADIIAGENIKTWYKELGI